MVKKRKEYSITSKISEIDSAVEIVTDFAREHGFSEDQLFGVDIAVREAVANAVKHGNKLDENKKVDISLASSASKFEITVRDYGEGFSVENVPDPTDSENVLKESGRGILFMQSFVDSVKWSKQEDGGMKVEMSKSI